ncbi:hypothetical protein [Enterovibrio nigricans]|uniref:Uncharacterized protein n=1 Tax=Enterovibrio nigricans DSM 22720 TaxID=1121868 RepID=A0A1T4V0L8_9GAMM|nr:hypothetical protein [Enterovibrio nigricans]PKF49105.1 hypothetical protein AT251_21330 [Enterovibrio nigricans]SKA58513.1 hypothetical protein SAMN02745132_02987 [Enterovibrio nigricans DSM 22720]
MPSRNNQTNTLLKALCHFFSLALLVALPVLVVQIDIGVLHNGLSEQSLTEYLENVLLVSTIACYVYIAVKNPSFRHFGMLVAGFFLCLFIRELDKWFDDNFWHGFWVYPAALVAATALIYALADRQACLSSFTRFVKSRNFTFLCLGLSILLVFSRLFGMGALWHDILTDGYVRTAKNVAEEGSELLAYFLIFYASLRYVWDYCYLSQHSHEASHRVIYK